LVLTGLAAVGLITSMLPAWGARNIRARFQGLGQMPGVVIQPGECGTQAFGISGDGNVIVGAGCVPSSQPGGFVDQAFRWTVAGGNAWWKTSGETGNFGDGSCTDPQAPLTMVDLSADGSLAAGSGKGGLDMFGQQATNAYQSTPTGNCQDIDAVFNRNSDASGISADGST